MGISLVPGSLTVTGMRGSCSFRIAAPEVVRVLNRALTHKRLAIAGFRSGRVPAFVALSRYRDLSEAALCNVAKSHASQIEPGLSKACVPPEYIAVGLEADGSFIVECHWLTLPETPQPWKAAAPAGVGPYSMPQLPGLTGRLAAQQLMPDSIRMSPQLQHFQLGAAALPQQRGQATTRVPQAGQVGTPRLPQFPGQGTNGAHGHRPSAVATPPVPAPEQALPRGGA